MRRKYRSGFRPSAHSHILITFHPFSLNCRAFCRSLALLAAIFCCQSAAFVFGVKFRPHSCPCQKHPSTNKATRDFGQTKSGLPTSGACRRQPVIPFALNKLTAYSSVVLLPRLRIRDINCDRVKPPKVVCCVWAPLGQ